MTTGKNGRLELPKARTWSAAWRRWDALLDRLREIRALALKDVR